MGRPAVLVIDDEPANLRVFQRVFRSTFDVTVAQTWAEARELLASRQPDVVFVDLCMPLVNGLEVLAHLRDLIPNAARYLLTGYGDSPEVVAARQSGMCKDVLAKPFERATVTAAVAAVIDSR
jgi:CheY-like chemotaxis protein